MRPLVEPQPRRRSVGLTVPPACGTRRGKTLGTFVAKVCLTSAVPDVASCAHNGDRSRVAHPVAISTLEALLAAGIDEGGRTVNWWSTQIRPDWRRA